MKKHIITFVRIILGILGAVLLAWFLIPGILTFNFHIGTNTGIIISALMILYSILFYKINSLVKMIWSRIPGKIMLIIISAAAVAIIVLAFICMVCMGSGMKKTGRENTTVVVLGCRVYHYGPSLMLLERLSEAYYYLHDNPDSVCIVCGGQGKNEPVTEASAMADYLTGRGISMSRIYIDDTSMDTFENLTNAAEIIDKNGLKKECTIVTSNYHCYRAKKYAQQLGYENPDTIPAYTLWWLFPSSYVREMYGILEMWFLN